MHLPFLVSLLLVVPLLGMVGAEEVKPGKHSSRFLGDKSGMRGWTEAKEWSSYAGEWMNSKLVVVTAAKEKKTFSGGVFIRDWGFADKGKSVVIRSSAAHGPAWMQKFEIASGKLLAECPGSDSLEDTPEWARPWCDATELAKEEKEAAEKEAAAKKASEKKAAAEKKTATGQ